jgi:hypothetical protein
MYKLVYFLIVVILVFPITVSSEQRASVMNFSEQFNNPRGWYISNGSWSYGGSVLQGYGRASYWHGVFYGNSLYSTLDYKARVRRFGCSDCSTGIFVRASGLNRYTGTWANGFWVTYTNNGDYIVWKKVNNRVTFFRGWTYTNRIAQGCWNELRITALNNVYRVYINRTLIVQVIDNSLRRGHVGVEMYSAYDTDSMSVDWATLTTNIR